MMLKKIFPQYRGQKGFTLVEILVAMTITAVIGSALTMTIFQLLSTSIGDKNRMEAVKQVENALHYLNRDVQMSDSGLISPADGTEASFNPGLNLQWTDHFDGDTVHNVTYSIVPVGGVNCLQRDDNGQTITVARYIEPENSNYSFDGRVISINLVANISGYKSATESRNLQVQPRMGQ